MRLRKQLLFLSLITLSLPWVGCQYIREMDAALRDGQSQSLHATAKAVSAHISNDKTLLPQLGRYQHAQTPLYAHTLQSPISIDGYEEDWLSQSIAYDSTPGNTQDSAPHQIMGGTWQNSLHLFIKITQNKIRYFNPSEKGLRHCDHIIIHTADQSYALYASAPGQLTSRRLGQNGTITTEHLLHGHWLEWQHGYQIELALPLHWSTEGLYVEAVKANSNSAQEITLQPLIRHADALSQALNIFSSSTTKLSVVTTTGHILAQSGDTDTNITVPRQHGLVEWFYRLALGNQAFPDYPKNFPQGIFQDSAVSSALTGQYITNWYHADTKRYVRSGLPITTPKGAGTSATEILGAVIIEQSGHSLTGVTNNAFNRLLIYSFLASIFAAVCLVAYATWLSLRIRKLSEAAANAVSESGKISEDFPISQSADEIGELSRSYAQLLARLREYTSYLRTLSSKLSHELRTPLAIVRSSLDNLEYEGLDGQAKVYAERAREGTSRLSSILNAMSAASRVEQAIDSTERESIPCDELLSSLYAAYKDVYPKVCFTLNIVEYQQQSEFMTLGSGELIVQALDKLVDNAADFCPENGEVTLGLCRQQTAIVFSVFNEGPPLPTQMHGQLFDSMVSVRGQSTDSHHLGLGLYIVRLITDFHQGEARAYNSADNRGVIFEISIPAKPLDV